MCQGPIEISVQFQTEELFPVFGSSSCQETLLSGTEKIPEEKTRNGGTENENTALSQSTRKKEPAGRQTVHTIVTGSEKPVPNPDSNPFQLQ